MFFIRDAQMRKFREARQADFENRAVELRTSRGEPSEAARTFVRDGIRFALNLKITSEDDILRFLDLLPSLGYESGQDTVAAWAAEILNDTDLTASLRFKLLERVPPKP